MPRHRRWPPRQPRQGGPAHLRWSPPGRGQAERDHNRGPRRDDGDRGRAWLRYKSFPIDVALIQGTAADTAGNITMEREVLTLDKGAAAMEANDSRGFVIVQVERIAETGSLNLRDVEVSGVLVGCIVLAAPESHVQTYGTAYTTMSIRAA